MRTRLSSTWRHSSLSFSFSPFLSLSLPSSITLCLSFSFSRPTGVRRHNNCDTYRMHSFRVGNVSLDVATFASANPGGETLLPHFAITTLALYSLTLAIYTHIYILVCTCGDSNVLRDTYTHECILEPRDRRPFWRSSLWGNQDRLESKGNQPEASREWCQLNEGPPSSNCLFFDEIGPRRKYAGAIHRTADPVHGLVSRALFP